MKIKNWILIKKTPIITLVIGGVSGWLYWYYIGCASGTCAITSVWWKTMIYGAIMGWLVGDFVNDKFNSKRK